jgi:hypothetical protein
MSEVRASIMAAPVYTPCGTLPTGMGMHTRSAVASWTLLAVLAVLAALTACASSPPASEQTVAPAARPEPAPPPAEPPGPSVYERRWKDACTKPGTLDRCPAPFDRPAVFFDAKTGEAYAPPALCGAVGQTSPGDLDAQAALVAKRAALRACFRGAERGAWVDLASDGSRPPSQSPELPERTIACAAKVVKQALPDTSPSSVKRVVVMNVGPARGRDREPALSKANVDAMITAHAEDISTCYDGALEVWPGLSGRIAPSVVVWFDGSVALVSTAHSSLDNPALECCIETAVRGFRFGPPDDGNIAIVTVPLLLGEPR